MSGPRIRKAPRLAELTSIGLGGPALAEILVEDRRSLDALPELLISLGGRPVILGRGSNILAADGELPLVLIRLGGELAGPARLLEERAEEAVFAAPAGLPLPVLVQKLCRAGCAGLQGLAGIPGSVGGAVAMNAGSFGLDTKSVLAGVSFFSPRHGFVERRAEELEIGYRSFAAPGLEDADWLLILEARLKCAKAPAAGLLAEAESCGRRKAAAQPVGARSAGCVFKNHALGPAGRLLEEAGFKGRRLGGMAFSDLHANFLLNVEQGSAAEARELIAQAREAVKAVSGANLDLEVRLWP